jgi:hypothetical protein
MRFGLKKRRGVAVAEIIILIVGLTIAAILAGSVLINGLGTLANGTAGSACTKCDATTKALLPNINIFIVIGIMLAIIGAGVFAFTKGAGGLHRK